MIYFLPNSFLILLFFSNDKDFIDKIGDNNGYFDRVIKPMLQNGHEKELCYWLIEMNLLQGQSNCPSEECKNTPLQWKPIRNRDKYTWECPTCNKKQSIRNNSHFLKVNCEIKRCMQIILAWCQSVPLELTTEILGNFVLYTYIYKSNYIKYITIFL